MLIKINMSITEQLIHTTVRIESFYDNDTKGTGTGFFFKFKFGDRSIPLIITNKHVVRNAKKGRLKFKVQKDGSWNREDSVTIEINDFEKGWIMHPDSDVDLCAFPMVNLIEKMVELGKIPHYSTITEDIIPTQEEYDNFMAIEEIVMIGYPNGIWDSANNLPILRKGITATHPNIDYNGKSEFLIDAACFPGSSGSPVFLLNLGGYSDRSGVYVGTTRVKFLGVLYSGPQHTTDGEIKIIDVPVLQKPISRIMIPNNLGIIIKSKKVQDFKNIFGKFVDEKWELKDVSKDAKIVPNEKN